jgi:hypothetical protein
MSAFFRCALLGLLAASGCTRVDPLPPRVPELPRQAWELSGPGADNLQASPPPAAPSLAKTAQGLEPKPGFARNQPLSVPGGSACIAELRARGIGFSETKALVGVHTPVLLTAPLDGVRFRSTDGRRFEADCRLVLALSRIAPELRALGVTEVRYSGTYVYRYSRAGRLSNHAYGLAIDVHALTADNLVLEVKRDFARGAACSAASGLLNRVACRVRSQRVFPEQLGPDDNADHHDHFHFGLRPLPGELPAELPAPKPAPRRRKRNSRG